MIFVSKKNDFGKEVARATKLLSSTICFQKIRCEGRSKTKLHENVSGGGRIGNVLATSVGTYHLGAEN